MKANRSRILRLPRTKTSRKKLFKQLLNRDRAPLGVLIAAAFIGTLVGLVGVAFAKAVEYISTVRESTVAHLAAGSMVKIFVAFALSALLGAVGYWLVKRYAPEAGGSGIPEIEGALDELRPVRWWRVLPVKFIGGLGTLGSGMVLGREGPTVQLGGNLGQFCVDLFRMKNKEARHSLLATGAASGLVAAFNAPLAGILFIIEEMRPHFRYNLISIKAVFIGVIFSSVVFRIFNGDNPVIGIGKLDATPVNTLWLFLILGLVFGIVGVVFNKLIFLAQDFFARVYKGRIWVAVLIGTTIAGGCGVIELTHPELVGGGNKLIPQVALGSFTFIALLTIFFVRVLTTVICFSSGAPGGIFAPMLTLGTVLGTSFGLLAAHYFPNYHLQIAIFAVAGMGALFAASVRAPLTGIVLVLEMTNNYQLILPMIVTCLGATLLAQFLGGQPLYSAILTRTLAKEKSSMGTE